MPRRNTLTLIVILILFAFSLWAILPIEGERLGREGMRLGLDLQGGIHMVYKADLSQVEPGYSSD